jgi:hypothetical protein
MIERMDTGSPRILGFVLKGRLHDEDYRAFAPVLEAAIATLGKVRLLARFVEFRGWDLHAAWDDFKLGVAHYDDFERIAMVGDKEWEAWMARLCRPFTKASVRYFDASDVEGALAWLREGA